MSHRHMSWQVSKELATGHSGPKSPHQATDSALALFPLLQQLLICPVFRPVVVSDALIADLSAYLAASASASVADLGGIAQFQVRSCTFCSPSAPRCEAELLSAKKPFCVKKSIHSYHIGMADFCVRCTCTMRLCYQGAVDGFAASCAPAGVCCCLHIRPETVLMGSSTCPTLALLCHADPYDLVLVLSERLWDWLA